MRAKGRNEETENAWLANKVRGTLWEWVKKTNILVLQAISGHPFVGKILFFENIKDNARKNHQVRAKGS